MKSTSVSLFVCLILICQNEPAQGQALVGAATRWPDSFREWALYDDEGEVGSLEWKGLDRDGWTEFRIRYQGIYGNARLKWPDRTDEWELRLGQEVITIRAVYRGDPSQWRIIGHEIQLTFQSKHPRQPEEWQIREKRFGLFRVYTRWQGDLREWVVEDQLEDERISSTMRLAMLFTALANATPKF
jgi:hypothetical protein